MLCTDCRALRCRKRSSARSGQVQDLAVPYTEQSDHDASVSVPYRKWLTGSLSSESVFVVSLEIDLQRFIEEGNSYWLGTIILLIMQNPAGTSVRKCLCLFLCVFKYIRWNHMENHMAASMLGQAFDLTKLISQQACPCWLQDFGDYNRNVDKAVMSFRIFSVI